MYREVELALAARLREKRAALKLTQSDVARQIKVTRQLVSAWERAETPPTLDQLRQLCELYGSSADYILFGIRPLREYSHPILQQIFGTPEARARAPV